MFQGFLGERIIIAVLHKEGSAYKGIQSMAK